MAFDVFNWQRRSALFDAACEVPLPARAAWLAALQQREPQHSAAIQKMLAEYDQSAAQNTEGEDAGGAKPSLLGFGSRAFEAGLEAATADAPGLILHAGDRVGAWQLVRKIGEGGMGAVWLAGRHDGHFEGHAAIKFLRTGLGKSEVVQRFLRERRLLARLTHGGIARMLDAGAHAGEPYLVMEYIQGEPITTWAAQHAPRVADRVALLLKVCRAIEYAHGQLIVHRDLKPSNVLVSTSGEPSLLDFGIAKLIDDEGEDYGTALTRMTGRGYTLGYCAPEQISGEPTGVAADVFSVGVLLFELLTGMLPYRPAHGGRAALEHAIVHTDAMRLSKALDTTPATQGRRPVDADNARGDLDAIVGKALRRNPADRYATMGALASDLSRWINRLPVRAHNGNWQYKTLLWFKRNRTLASVISLAFIAVSAGMVTALWQAGRANDEAQRASTEARRADVEKTAAIEQRRRAETATAQATAALAESEQAKGAALRAQKQASDNALQSRQAQAQATESGRKAQAAATKAQAVNQYLVTLFESADPEHTKGEKLTAREVLDTGSKSLAMQFAKDPETLAELQAVLGQTYVGLSLPQTAIPLLTAAAAFVESKFGARSVQHARIVHTLARAEMEAEIFPDSEKHYRLSLDVLEPVDGIASESIVIGKINLANALQKQGQFAKIEPLLAPVRAAIIAQRGEKDWLFAEIENSRAVAMAAQGKIQDEQAILRSIEPLLANPPPSKRSDALTIRNNLAVSIARGGNLAEAIPRVDGVVAGYIALLGPEAELTMKVMWFAGDLRRQAGQYADCASMYERLGELRARITGPTHPLTVDVLSKVAVCAQMAGNTPLATQYGARALAALPQTDEPPQRTVLRTLLSLQFVALDRADAPPLPALLPRARALARAINLAPATPEALWIAAIEACAAARAGNTQAALQAMDTALTKAPAFVNLPTAKSLHAYLLALDGQTDAARAELLASQKLAKLRFPDSHSLFRVLEYVDGIATRPNDQTEALRTLEANAGRKARIPLAPNWFGL